MKMSVEMVRAAAKPPPAAGLALGGACGQGCHDTLQVRPCKLIDAILGIKRSCPPCPQAPSERLVLLKIWGGLPHLQRLVASRSGGGCSFISQPLRVYGPVGTAPLQNRLRPGTAVDERHGRKMLLPFRHFRHPWRSDSRVRSAEGQYPPEPRTKPAMTFRGQTSVTVTPIRTALPPSA